MKAFNYITSETPGAPQLPNTPGSLLTVLEAVLETGIGLTVVNQITASSGVVTITVPSTPSALEAGLIELTGISGPLSILNGVHRVEAIGVNSITIIATASDGSTSAAGMTVRIPPLGWRKAFSDGNVAVYDSPSAKWQGCFVRFDDSAANTCLVRAYAGMTDAHTGVDAFPTFAQRAAAAFYLIKYQSGSFPRRWAVWGNELFFAIGVSSWVGSELQSNGLGWMYFGLPRDIAAGDANATIIKANINNASWTTFSGADSSNTPYMARSFSAATVSQPVSSYLFGGSSISAVSGITSWIPGVQLEDKNSGMLFDHPVALLGPSGEGYRGTLPGVRHIPHSRVSELFSPFQIVKGADGRKMVFFRVVSNLASSDLAQHGGAFVEVEGWDS